MLMNRISIISALILLCVSFVSAQTKVYKVTFSDKGMEYSIDNPGVFLSDESLYRRYENNIPVNESDLPVAPEYIKVINEKGYDIILKSKWFNAVFVQTDDSEKLSNIKELPFVENIELVDSGTRNPNQRSSKFGNFSDKMPVALAYNFDYGNSYIQNAMIKADSLHESGFIGTGIKIAVLDGGFMGTDTIAVFSDLYEENRVLGEKDFVDNGTVYAHSGHGTAVLSQIGGFDEGNLIGTAPGASFYLLRTEDVYAEYLLEEYFWAAGAEYADSAGVHIINSSLGYSEFDDPAQNHTYEDMDGNTTPISIAAEMAAEKGILVVTSAGNEGDGDWQYITAPGDAAGAITVGAVTADGIYAPFSSIGPTSDGRIKPDVMAMGQGNLVSTPTGGMSFGSGTSFASPLIAGLAACILEAQPARNIADVRDALRNTASRNTNPSPTMGYGIANGVGAMSVVLQTPSFIQHNNITIFPNPVLKGNTIYIESPGEILNIGLFSSSGAVIPSDILKISDSYAEITPTQKSQEGIIYLKVYLKNSVSVFKAVVL
ncbi:MAG: hypothetical protein C0593_01225 [Marinilabiliales bacterium]|nr:MAG: hypothetical protein C0593_01225 [Marinilabiliales bacterium]